RHRSGLSEGQEDYGRDDEIENAQREESEPPEAHGLVVAEPRQRPANQHQKPDHHHDLREEGPDLEHRHDERGKRKALTPGEREAARLKTGDLPAAEDKRSRPRGS